MRVASRIIRNRPHQLVFIAPVVSFLFTVGAGTGNIFFPLIPVIYDVAYENKIRPERPLAVSCVASQMGIVASPVSAATAVMLSVFEPKGFSLASILLIVFPATLIGILVASVVQMRIGKELFDDPEYKRRLAAGEIQPPRVKDENAASQIPLTAKLSAFIFVGGVVLTVILGLFSQLRPEFPGANGKPVPLSMTVAIQLIMLTVATVILIIGKVSPKKIISASVLSSGVAAIVALFGIVWLADTFVAANQNLIVGGLEGVVDKFPLMFAIALFAVAAITTSQSGAAKILMPVGLALGIAPQLLIAMFPAVMGIYFFPANGSQLAAVNFDETGTTRIGKYVLNHSFMLPTLVSVVVALLVGIGLAAVLHGV